VNRLTVQFRTRHFDIEQTAGLAGP
jgi:hypothetical protein